MYDFNQKIVKFIPPKPDLDYEENLGLKNNQSITLESIDSLNLLGGRAIVIKNKGQKEQMIFSPVVKTIDLKQGVNYILLVYAHNFQNDAVGYESKAFLTDRMNPPVSYIYLNPGFGVFRATPSILEKQMIHPFSNFLEPTNNNKIRDQGIMWEILFFLIPIKKGTHDFIEGFFIKEGANFFDGFQSYLLYK